MNKLDTTIQEYHLLKHPFYQRWMQGTLSKSELQQYAKNYFPHVMAFPTYVSAVHAQVENDLPLRQALLENLIEEERGEDNHPALWLRFAQSLDVSEDEVKNARCLEQAHNLVKTFKTLCSKSVASGLGALYAYESQVPEIAKQKIEGLKKNFGVTSESGLKFFTAHIGADELHSQTEKNAIENLPEEEQEEARRSAETAAKALWSFLSALDENAHAMPC